MKNISRTIRNIRLYQTRSMVWQEKDEKPLPLTHIRGIKSSNSVDYMPTMVDVSEKTVTQRTAHAQGKIFLPDSIVKELDLANCKSGEIVAKKGPVIATSIVAGVMAVKKTSSLIPFCHPIPIEKCDLNIELKYGDNQFYFEINCVVKTEGKTGVEMEALVGVSNAALCLYDMLKAISHEMVISNIGLISKAGGKRTIENHFDHLQR